MSKIRIDKYLVEKGFFSTREKARSHLMAGKVLLNEHLIDKAGYLVDPSIENNIRVKESCPFVSRGGYKLEHAINEFNLSLENLIIVDIGASTGGFTDVCLQNKAKFIYAVDVGTNQLDYSLRNNPKVKSIENTNARYINKDLFDFDIDLAVIDVSFISVRKIIPNLVNLLKKPIQIISLIKPQFEIEKPDKSFKGVVTDIKKHQSILLEINQFLNSLNLFVNNVCYSPITGPKGNIEYFFLINDKMIEDSIQIKIDNIISIAKDRLK